MKVNKDKKVLAYQVYDKDKLLYDLTEEQVNKINSGETKMPEQMDVFFSNDVYEFVLGDGERNEKSLRDLLKFNKEDNLNFEWIQEQGHKIILLVDDLVSFAHKFNMFDHNPDLNLIKQLDELDDQREEILANLEKKEDLFRKYRDAVINGNASACEIEDCKSQLKELGLVKVEKDELKLQNNTLQKQKQDLQKEKQDLQQKT